MFALAIKTRPISELHPHHEGVATKEVEVEPAVIVTVPKTVLCVLVVKLVVTTAEATTLQRLAVVVPVVDTELAAVLVRVVVTVEAMLVPGTAAVVPLVEVVFVVVAPLLDELVFAVLKRSPREID